MTYQSEAELEKQLIAKLQTQGYTYVRLNEYKDLEDNYKQEQESIAAYIKQLLTQQMS